jgi:thiazole synthase
VPAPAGDLPALRIADRELRSRLLLGSGGFTDLETFRAALSASGSALVTVAMRRIDQAPPGLLEAIDAAGVAVLPNTAGCYDADEAVRTAHLAREALGTSWIKLEVIGDPIGLLEAARRLIADDFTVLPYCGDDLIVAQRLEAVGCAAVMPLGSPIGSGLGLLNPFALETLRERIQVPLILDAGVGTASDAAQAMEIGIDAILAASAISRCGDPVAMARAMALAIEAGGLAARAGRIPPRRRAVASTPEAGRPDLGGAG